MIDVINKLNREFNSLTTIIIDNKEFFLSNKDLQVLVDKLYYKREDLFNNILLDYEDKIKADIYSEYEDTIKSLESTVSELSSYIEDDK